MKSDIDKSLDLPTNFDATRMTKPVQSLEESGCWRKKHAKILIKKRRKNRNYLKFI